MSLITDLHWWGQWWSSGYLGPWSLTCIDEVPDDDLDVYVPDHWPALMRSLMMFWMSMSLITDLHWWGPWWWSGYLGPWSLTCIDEVPDDDLDVYVSDHWSALMRSLMKLWISRSLITDLYWWGPWWWSGCPWSLTCIDEIPDDDMDVYVPDHWPTLMRSLMMFWMSMSLITDLHWWGPWWCSGCLCPWSLTCIDKLPDDVLDVYVPDHWPALMRSLMMFWMSMSLITDLHWWGPWWCSGCLCPWSLTYIDEVPDDVLDVYVPDHWPALISSLMMIWMSLITDLHWWGPWWCSGCLCLWELDFRNCPCSATGVGTVHPRCTSDSRCRRFSEILKLWQIIKLKSNAVKFSPVGARNMS